MTISSRTTAVVAVVLLVIGSLAGYFVSTSTLVPRVTQTTTVTVAETRVETVTTSTVKLLILTLTGPPNPDTILYNGVVLTMEEDQPYAQALAVQGNRILAVGSDAEILALRTQKTKVTNLEGKTLLPGFVDAHTHPSSMKWYLEMTLSEVQQLALENGITSFADMYTDPNLLREWQMFKNQGKLHIRTSLYLNYNTACGVVEPSLGDWYRQHRPTRQPAEMLRIGGVKVVTDGGYCGSPAASFIEGGGDLWFTQSELNRVVAEAHAAGYQVVLHALGDRAVEQTQNAIQFVLAGKLNTLRHRIDHNAVVPPHLLARYSEIGIVAVVFGYVPTCGIATGEWVLPCSGCTWGQEQQPWMWPYRKFLDTNPGLHAAWHSDFPAWGSINPLLHLHSLVTRNEVAKDGSVCEAPEWLAANGIPVQRALRLMNIDAAYALFREEEVGSLRPGKFADLVILSENPLTVDPDRIKDIRVLVTVVGGHVEYCASGHERLCKPVKYSATDASGMQVNFPDPTVPVSVAVILSVWHMRDIRNSICQLTRAGLRCFPLVSDGN